MDGAVKGICEALKKICLKLKPQNNPISFLLIIGKNSQGKSALLRQSNLNLYTSEHTDIYYNQHGIILKINETEIEEKNISLSYLYKKLNNCHRALKITGLIITIDINELIGESTLVIDRIKTHAKLVNKIANDMPTRPFSAIFFTKLDSLAGFLEFFHNEHKSELKKQLGFSILNNTNKNKFIESFKNQIDNFIEMLSQQVIHKIHPVRSGTKRSLIREFPLQLASLKNAMQLIIQNISLNKVALEAIYFTSSEQGGLSLDRVTKKIQNQFALIVQDSMPQATNYRSYFIEGAIRSLQLQTKYHYSLSPLLYKGVVTTSISISVTAFFWLINSHLNTANLLDDVSKRLIISTTANSQNERLIYLNEAEYIINNVQKYTFSLKSIETLKQQLTNDTKQNLKNFFLPQMLSELETVLINDNRAHHELYNALKIYLMLGDKSRFSQQEIITWFQNKWQNEGSLSQDKLNLLNQAVLEPFQPQELNQNLINNTRNYLNALPQNYLYYLLAKQFFPQQKEKLDIAGFRFVQNFVPEYLTRQEFNKIIGFLPQIANELKNDSWVLNSYISDNLKSILENAYFIEYTTFWQNILNKIQTYSFNTYNEGHQLLSLLESNNSFENLINRIQKETSPQTGQHLFNSQIANKFSGINLISQSQINELTLNLRELDRFLLTLSMMNDEGENAFRLTKERFNNENLNTPLNMLFKLKNQTVEPISGLINQIATDTWVILINDCKKYINNKWLTTVYTPYQNSIASHYPFAQSNTEVPIYEFERFFAPHGVLNNFVNYYVAPFLDMSQAKWQAKAVNNFVLPFKEDILKEIIRANVITNMFFPGKSNKSRIDFTLQKLALDPVIANIEIAIGPNAFFDDQQTQGYTSFRWPVRDVIIKLTSLDGDYFTLEEQGQWALFRLLEKISIFSDEQDPQSINLSLDIQGNNARYALKTFNKINPFTPGILNSFHLKENIV